MKREYNLAIVLSGGRGNRMNSEMPKQYLPLGKETVLSCALRVFADCSFIDEIIIVAAPEYITYCKEHIVSEYGIRKVSAIVAGGQERYDSVYCGLKAFQDRRKELGDVDRINVYIHDGARPLLDHDVLMRAREAVNKYDACAVGVPVKDTIKICDRDDLVIDTPDRSALWSVQTPQVFHYDLIMLGHELFQKKPVDGVTDDAMIAEKILRHPVHMVMGSYSNIKITTPEDLVMAEAILNAKRSE